MVQTIPATRNVFVPAKMFHISGHSLSAKFQIPEIMDEIDHIVPYTRNPNPVTNRQPPSPPCKVLIAATSKSSGRRLNGFLGLSLNNGSILFLVSLLDKTVFAFRRSPFFLRFLFRLLALCLRLRPD